MNTTTFKSRVAAFLAGAILALTAATGITATASAAKSDAASAAKPSNQSIVDIVLADDGEFDVLQAAVIEAGLAGALDSKRQYTVFAPTDAAFVNSLQVANESEAIEAVKDLPSHVLGDILGNHVTKGRRTSTSVLASPSYRMINNDRLTRSELADAGIFKTDISASNGIVHVINSVLMP